METTRRLFLRNTTTAVAVQVATATVIAKTVSPAVDRWLEDADPLEVAKYYMEQVAKAMERLTPTRTFRWDINPKSGVAFVVGDIKP